MCVRKVVHDNALDPGAADRMFDSDLAAAKSLLGVDNAWRQHYSAKGKVPVPNHTGTVGFIPIIN